MTSTQNPNDLALKLALAKELPELIEFCPKGTPKPNPYAEDCPTSVCEDTFFWAEEQAPVTPREWDWIMREVEKKLTDGQYDAYEQELAKAVGFQCYDEWPAPSGLRLVISAPWQTRAIAYFKTIGKEIK